MSSPTSWLATPRKQSTQMTQIWENETEETGIKVPWLGRSAAICWSTATVAWTTWSSWLQPLCGSVPTSSHQVHLVSPCRVQVMNQQPPTAAESWFFDADWERPKSTWSFCQGAWQARDNMVLLLHADLSNCSGCRWSKPCSRGKLAGTKAYKST